MCGGEGTAPEAVAAHTADAHLFCQLADSGLCPSDAERLAGDAGENPAFLSGGANLAPLMQPLAGGWGWVKLAENPRQPSRIDTCNRTVPISRPATCS
jgi:hypothetical protein